MPEVSSAKVPTTIKKAPATCMVSNLWPKMKAEETTVKNLRVVVRIVRTKQSKSEIVRKMKI